MPVAGEIIVVAAAVVMLVVGAVAGAEMVVADREAEIVEAEVKEEIKAVPGEVVGDEHEVAQRR